MSKKPLTSIALMLCCAIVATITLIGGLYFIQTQKNTLKEETEKLETETRLISPQLQSALEEMQKDVLMISQFPPIQGLIRSTQNNDIDPLDGSTTDLWRTRLETIFKSVIAPKTHYMQIRYIGVADNGRELVRVDRAQNSVKVIAPDQLQQKAQEPYFQAGLNLKPGQVYYSTVNLNREHNKVQKPYLPVMRTILPVYDNKTNTLFGLIVINAAYDQFLKTALSRFDISEDLYVINDTNHYIAFKGGEEEVIAFSLPGEEVTSPLHTDVVTQTIKETNDTGTLFTIAAEQDTVIHYRKLFYAPLNKNRHLTLAFAVPQEKLFKEAYKNRLHNIGLSTGIIMLAILVGFLLIRVFPRLLRRMNDDDTHTLPHPQANNTKSESLPLLPLCISFAILTIVLLTDLYTPLGFAIGIAYVLAVFCSLWFDRYSAPFIFAAISTLLIVLGFYASLHSMSIPLTVLSNRALSIMAVWVTAFIVALQKQTQVKLQDSEMRTRSILNNVTDGIITINPRGQIQSFNPACERIFGHTAEETIGQNANTLIPKSRKTKHGTFISQYFEASNKETKDNKTELECLRKDGTVFPIDLSVSRVILDKERLFIGIIRDITEQKKAQAERDRLIKELEISNEELDNFAYVASHDLKAPLRVIDNASKWLEEDLEEHLNDDTRESMELLRGRVGRMEKLLDDLLEYSRVGRATDDRFGEALSGKALLDNIKELLSPPKGFEIIGSPSLEKITVMRMPLQQILLNLISNAIKHHDKDHGTINVSVKDGKNQFIFTVTDDGPGIPKEFQGKVFKMFQTLKPRDQVEGSGMGLAMVYKNIQLHGGKITLTSEEGNGASFQFTWPKGPKIHQPKMINEGNQT